MSDIIGKNIRLVIHGQEFSALVTDISVDMSRGYDDITVFGDSSKSYIPGLREMTFSMNGFLTPPKENDVAVYATNTTNQINIGGVVDPPLSENARKHYREGGAPTRMGPKLMAKVPWESKRVSLIGMTGEGDEISVVYAKTLEEKQTLAFSSHPYLLVAWPGTYSQDLFFVTNLVALRKALKLKPASDVILEDEDGEVWFR